MRSRTRYPGVVICRTGLCALLLVSLLTPSASAWWPFKKKAPVEELPPSAQVKPTMIGQPGSEVEQKAKPDQESATPTTAPQPQVGQRRLPVVDPLEALVKQGVFPPELQAQTTPVTRSQLASVLVTALNHDTKLVSEFPFYRDVPLAHPSYVPIEVLRAKRLLIFPEEHGFFHPDQPITYGDLYLVISRAITGTPPDAERAEHLLRHIPEREALSGTEYAAVAKMAQSRFFERARRYETTFQPVEEAVTPEGLAPYISYMMFLNERRAPIVSGEEVLPTLPAGLRLAISPSTGILEERLKAGGRIYFQLVESVETIPRGSVLRGAVQSILPNRSYKIVFNSLSTTEGQRYETRAELMVTFSAKDKLGFIVPGETFEIVTQPVPLEVMAPAEPHEPETPTEAAPPPATPAKGVPNRDVLQQPVKTVPQ